MSEFERTEREWTRKAGLVVYFYFTGLVTTFHFLPNVRGLLKDSVGYFFLVLAGYSFLAAVSAYLVAYALRVLSQAQLKQLMILALLGSLALWALVLAPT